MYLFLIYFSDRLFPPDVINVVHFLVDTFDYITWDLSFAPHRHAQILCYFCTFCNSGKRRKSTLAEATFPSFKLPSATYNKTLPENWVLSPNTQWWFLIACEAEWLRPIFRLTFIAFILPCKIFFGGRNEIRTSIVNWWETTLSRPRFLIRSPRDTEWREITVWVFTVLCLYGFSHFSRLLFLQLLPERSV